MNRKFLHRGWLGAVLVLLPVLVACDSDGPPLTAVKITRQDQLIGGPSAKGKLGDFLIQNDRIRAIVGNASPGWAGGIFGGTLLDVDRHRWRSQYQYGKGWDSFSEAFPLANLLVVNPSVDKNVLGLGKDGDDNDIFQIDSSVSGIRVLDAMEVVALAEQDEAEWKAAHPDAKDEYVSIYWNSAVIRVEGHTSYMFDMLKMLNREFLEGYAPSLLAGFLPGADLASLADLLEGFLQVNLFALLNRLQISFEFTTDYLLHSGDDYLTMRTTVVASPPAAGHLNGTSQPSADHTGQCDAAAFMQDMEDAEAAGNALVCPYGYVMEEIDEPVAGHTSPFKRLCPVYECAGRAESMPTFNEARDFFKVLLGDPDSWKDENWKGGIVAGDFLFYGSECGIFSPGLGYDYDRKIFENMWQGVGTFGSPLLFDWVAGTADNVSYAWTTRNPDRQEDFDCDTYRFAVLKVDPAREQDVVDALVASFGEDEGVAEGLVRAAVVDGKTFPLPVDPVAVGTPAPAMPFDDWVDDILAGPEATGFAADLGDGATLGLLPAHRCMPAKLLVPLFTTSATAVLTHFTEGIGMTETTDGRLEDRTRAYTFDRYITVGDGDVASAVQKVYDLRGLPYGTLTGVVLEGRVKGNNVSGSFEPITDADVFVLRALPDGSVPETFAAYREKALEAFGNWGFVTQIETDLGLDPDEDGDYTGAVPPGDYLAMAHVFDRGSSRLFPVTIEEGATERLNLYLPAPGRVEYEIVDGSGQSLPAALTFRPLDAQGLVHDWEGRNQPAFGDPRYDHGILEIEHSARGTGIVTLPPGLYNVVVSRGFEYGIHRIDGFEVESGQTSPLEAVLHHEMDTTGYIGADFHIHNYVSVDSSLPSDVRLKAAVAQGVEFFAATDHDHLFDYMPYILQLGLEDFLTTEISVEMSPLEWGHYNGFPLSYDDTKQTVHDPAQWPGVTLKEAWDNLRARGAGDPEDFVLEVNHGRDGFMGYFSQTGMKSYDLQRSTPGMEICNASLESTPCDFEAFEVLNGKHAEYLHTPTVAEVHRHNECYKEMVAAREPTADLCLWLQDVEEKDCEDAALAAAEAGLSEEEQADRILAREHCRWHLAFKDAVAACGQKDISLLSCKRVALEALKALSVRYMVERTPQENAAFFATTQATDVGCDYAVAMMGCEADATKGGCGEDCVCEICVCDPGFMPECCKTEAQGGTGWTQACADACRNDCHGCENRPCTDKIQLMQDWFAFLDAGLDVTGTANSDSHNILHQIGLPRTYVAAQSDSPLGLDPVEINRNLIDHKAILSAGPFVEFDVVTDDGQRATVGETLDASGATTVTGHIRVQTPSWFRVDRVEVYSNSRLIKRYFPEAAIEDLVDLETTLDLTGLAEDSWFIVVAYNLADKDPMTPVYKRPPYGQILIPTIISLGATQLLASFGSLLDQLGPIIGDVNDLLGSVELPDSFPIVPWGATNPIWIDVDGDGFLPPKARNARSDNGAWVWDLPPFCSGPCTDDSDCGDNQTCLEDAAWGGKICKIPIPDNCVPLQPVGSPEG